MDVAPTEVVRDTPETETILDGPQALPVGGCRPDAEGRDPLVDYPAKLAEVPGRSLEGDRLVVLWGYRRTRPEP